MGVRHITGKPLRLLSHYTSMQGFKSIIESESLWATNVAFLNDNKEYTHAFDIFESELSKFEEDQGSVEEHDSYFFRECKGYINSLKRPGIRQHYVVSLSSEIDQLSQWRAYGSIGIVFYEDKMEQCIRGVPGADLVGVERCRYNEFNLRGEIKNRVSEIFDEYKKIAPEKGKECIFDLMEDFYEHMLLSSTFCKAYGFKEEKEVRLSFFSTGEEEVKFRVNHSYLVPYLEVPFDKSAIERIVIGPCIDLEKTKKSVELFMERHFPLDERPSIVDSDIPYRNW